MGAALDLGSRNVKVVVADGRALGWEIFDTAGFYRTHAGAAGSLDLAPLGIAPDADVATTGYGRRLVASGRVTVVPEIRAHAAGVSALAGRRTFVMVDIGGQDVKVAVVRRGRVESFTTNDKCAAGTGRYLENAARALGLDLDALAGMDRDPEPLSATCAIFGESEMIGKLAAGVAVERIAAGANLSVAKRLVPMVAGLDPRDVIVTGGVARNRALVRLLAGLVPQRVSAVAHPELTGALGALSVLSPASVGKPTEIERALVRGLGA